MIRYEDEANEQVIETDIRQHKGSVKMDVHGINGFVFEWYGAFHAFVCTRELRLGLRDG